MLFCGKLFIGEMLNNLQNVKFFIVHRNAINSHLWYIVHNAVIFMQGDVEDRLKNVFLHLYHHCDNEKTNGADIS